jgi:hypothetical protein
MIFQIRRLMIGMHLLFLVISCIFLHLDLRDPLVRVAPLVHKVHKVQLDKLELLALRELQGNLE